jgi:quercetin dioxygenase-like cupin family protein
MSPARERLVYVLSGKLSSTVGQATREIGKEMLLIVRPSATAVRLASASTPDTVIVVFDAL